MSQSVRRLAVLGCLALATLSPVLASTEAGAAKAPATASPVATILNKTDGYLTKVRAYFLCSTTKCKKDRTTLLASARSSMTSLWTLSNMAATARVQAKYHSGLNQYVRDMISLKSSYAEFFVTSSQVTLSGLVGNIFYQSSDVASDVNVLRAAEQKKTVAFDLWVVGEAATLVAMQTDASALQSSSATTSIGIYANQLLEAESHSLISHAHGPVASFNTQLVTFANNQLRISQSEVLYLQGKKAPMSETQVANLNVSVSKEFAALITTETKLVKKK